VRELVAPKRSTGKFDKPLPVQPNGLLPCQTKRLTRLADLPLIMLHYMALGGKMPGAKDRLTTTQWILERNLAWIAAADAKVAIIVTINVAMLGGLAGTFGWSDAHRSCWAYGACMMATILNGSGVFCAAMAMFPRTDGPKQSLLFSVPVACMTLPDYQAALKDRSDEQLLEDWAGQVHRNAEIAKSKFEWVRVAMIWSFLGAPAWIIAIGVMLSK
jgi:hypothetical protein